MFGENAAERGSGFGPWTVHISFRADERGIRDLEVDCCAGLGGSSSRYAEPVAEGTRPVFRTEIEKIYKFSSAHNILFH